MRSGTPRSSGPLPLRLRRHAAAALGALSIPALAAAAHARPLSFSDALHRARQGAASVRVAAAVERGAEAQETAARARGLPQLLGVISGAFYDANGPYFVSGVETAPGHTSALYGEGALSGQWTVYDFGRTGAGIDAAERGVAAALLDRTAAEESAMEIAAAAYLVVAADEERVRAAGDALKHRETLLAIATELVRTGIRPPFEKLRAQVARESAAEELAVVLGKREADAAALASALGFSATERVEVESPSLPTVSPAVSPNAADARPQVAAARERVLQAERSMAESERGYLPNLSIQGSLGLYATKDLVQSADATSRAATAGATVVVPIFDGATHAAVKAADARLARARADRDAASLSARSEVVQASIAVATARRALDSSRLLVKAAADNMIEVETRYRAGTASPLELLDALGAEREARLRAIDVTLAHELATVRLLAATGGLEALVDR